MRSGDLEQLLDQYRIGAEGTKHPDARKANRYQAKMHDAYKMLRTTGEGRELISALLNDRSPHIRCWAAAHALEWNPESSIKTLEKLRDDGDACSFDAEMTLREYARGRLRFDY